MIDPKKLRQVRRAKDISQEQAAAALGLDQTTISAIERGVPGHSAKTIRRYAEWLGVVRPRRRAA